MTNQTIAIGMIVGGLAFVGGAIVGQCEVAKIVAITEEAIVELNRCNDALKLSNTMWELCLLREGESDRVEYLSVGWK